MGQLEPHCSLKSQWLPTNESLWLISSLIELLFSVQYFNNFAILAEWRADVESKRTQPRQWRISNFWWKLALICVAGCQLRENYLFICVIDKNSIQFPNASYFLFVMAMVFLLCHLYPVLVFLSLSYTSYTSFSFLWLLVSTGIHDLPYCLFILWNVGVAISDRNCQIDLKSKLLFALNWSRVNFPIRVIS